jgi:PAS domain S-box-containing protein
MTNTSAFETTGEGALPAGLLGPLLRISHAGVMVLRPVYAAQGGTIVDFTVAYLNPAAQRMLALPEQPAASFMTLYPTAAVVGVFGFYRDAYLSGREERRQNNYQFDGLDGYYLLAAQRHADVLVVSFTDTNEQPRTAVEESLRRDQARELLARAAAEAQHAELQRIFEQAPLALAVYQGPQHVVVLANEATARIWGRALPDILHRPVFEVLPEAATQDVVGIFDHVLTTGEPYVAHEQAARINRHGRLDTVYWNFVFQPQRGPDGQVTGIITLGAEVTELVRARRQVQELNASMAAANWQLQAAHEEALAHNAELERVQEQLRQLNAELEARVSSRTREVRAARVEAEQARQRLEQLFMEAPAGICIYGGPELVYELVNPRYQQLLPERRLLGRPLLEALPEVADQPVYALLREVYATGRTHEALGMLVPLARTAGGGLEDRYYNFVLQPRRDGQGQIDGVMVFVFEVTEQVRAGQQVQRLNEELSASNTALQRTNEQLRHTNRDLDTFVYTASHDLKAPIANIEGLLHALRAQLPAPVLQQPDTAQLLHLMDDSVARFQTTLGHLTDISRLQLMPAAPVETVPLAPLVEAVRLDLQPELLAAGAQLRIDVGACPLVRFSPKNLRSILYNLLSNALKYTHPGRPAQVELRARSAGGEMVLEVQDNGLGLSEQQQGQLFVLFRRLHTHVPGSGVGLYMVKRLVENAGGRVAVESRVGVGSTFRITLPG